MKKLNNVHLVNNAFQALRVFENNRINKDIDSVYQFLINNFSAIDGKVYICGSVAKIMHGFLHEDYKPKDVDILIKDPYFFRFLERNIQLLNVPFKIEELRIILFFPNIVVELWKYNPSEKENRIYGVYQNRINYCFYEY